jgi:hypothetical protein
MGFRPYDGQPGRYRFVVGLVTVNALGLTDLATFRVVGNPEVIPPIFRKILTAAVGKTGRNARPTLLQFAEPDVAVADWVIVVLQS